MDAHTQPLDWSRVSQLTVDPMSFLQIPSFDHADAPPLQLLTPPCSAVSPVSSPLTPTVTDGDTIVPVSTTFFPGADILTSPPDIVLLSPDSVFFYVHSSVLLGASYNAFKGLVSPSQNRNCGPTEPVMPVTEHSSVLNIILHSIYDMSCSHYAPSFETLSYAVAAFPKYGLCAEKFVAQSTPLYNLLLSHAPLYPLEVYALAAKHDILDLAAPTSSHLLSFPLASISDEMAGKIGPRYLKRLFFLHLGRLDALRRLLVPPPHPHAQTETCSFDDQKRLTSAWALASAYLAWDARPDMSTSTMQSALGPLEDQLPCNLCRVALREKLNHTIVQWSVIKRTI